MTTPAEHDALAQVRDEVLKMLPFRLPAGAVEDVIGFLGVLAADPGTRPAVLVALGLGGEVPPTDTVADLLTFGRETWSHRMHSGEQIAALGTVFGDLCRLRRDGGDEIDLQEFTRELGNLVLSCVRWIDDLGCDPQRAIDRAKVSQIAFTSRGEVQGESPSSCRCGHTAHGGDCGGCPCRGYLPLRDGGESRG